MATRRRTGFRRRRFGKPFVREQLVWSSNNFEETATTVDGIINNFVLFDPQQLQGGSGITGAPAVRYQVRRIIVNGGLGWTPQDTALANDIGALRWAIFVQNREDTDASLITTAQGDILEGGVERVLKTGCEACSLTELSGPASMNWRPPLVRFNEDLKVRVNLGFDDIIVLGVSVPLSSVVSLASMCLSTRCLVRLP